MTDKIIQDIVLEDNVILAIDDNNKELLRFSIKINNTNYIFKPPKYIHYNNLVKEYVMIITYIASVFPDTLIPSLEDMLNKNDWSSWNKITSKIFTNKKLIKMIENAIFKYMDFECDKKFKYFSKYKTIKQFRKDASIFDIQKIFAFICTIDDCIKKNYKIQMEKVFHQNIPQAQKPICSNGSGKNMDGQAEMYIMPRF